MTYLADRGARLCLVSFPVSPAYLEALAGAEVEHDAAIDFFRSVVPAGTGRFVDARAAVPDPDQFRDVDHLNTAGAQGFSARLLEMCFGGAG